MWVLQLPRELDSPAFALLSKDEKLASHQWVTHPTCAGCMKKHYTPLYPGHPKYPKNPPPGEFFYLDDIGTVLRFGQITGPPSTRPDPKDIEKDKKKVADYIKEKQAQKDKELEEANKAAEELLARDEEEQKKYEEEMEKKRAERKAAAEKIDAENMEKLKRGALKLGVAIVEAPPKAP
jgi:molecular chaperone DnaK (HSP70)